MSCEKESERGEKHTVRCDELREAHGAMSRAVSTQSDELREGKSEQRAVP